MLWKLTAATAATLGFFATAAMADTIDPTSVAADLAVGESLVVHKTVVVEAGTADASIDVMFLIDTTGSMSGAITGAKAAAVDILNGLAGFGDVASGAGVFGGGVPSLATAPPGSPINSDLTTTTATTLAAINSTTLGVPDGGGDFPERGQDAVKLVAENASWRPGAKRFIIALGDSSWNNNTVSDAEAIAALAGGAGTADDIELIGLRFSNYNSCSGVSDDCNFTESVEDLGGTVYATGTDPAAITAAILAGVTAAFEEYTTVSVNDFGAGLPEIAVSTVCTSAAAGGSCVGSDAVADTTWDRSADRTFEFDVTFTRMAAGDTSFVTCGTVDGTCVAKEADRFGGDDMPPVPLPAAGWLMIAGLGGLMAAKRRKA